MSSCGVSRRVDRRLLAAGVVLVVAGLGLALLQGFLSSRPVEGVPEEEPFCNASWTGWGRFSILSQSGDVFLVESGGENVTVYHTSIFYLAEAGLVGDVNNLSEAALALRNSSVIGVIEEGPEPAVVRVVLRGGEGYKILLGRGPCGAMIDRALATLYPGYTGLRSVYAGRGPVPVDAPGWMYNGVSLPVYQVVDSEGRRLTTLWVDPDSGLVVAELVGETPVLLVMAVFMYG